MALNNWVHMVVVYHGLNTGVVFSCYFNGQLVNIFDGIAGDLSGTGNLPGKMTLGSRYPNRRVTSNNVMLVDEIVMWDGQLNETQIKRLAVAHLKNEL